METLNVVIPYMYQGPIRHNNFKLCLNGVKRQNIPETGNDAFRVEVTIVETLKDGQSYLGDIEHGFTHISLFHDKYFNKSWSINVGVHFSSSNDILVLDCDIIFDKDYLAHVMSFRERRQFFVGYDYIYMLPGRDEPSLRVGHITRNRAVGGSWFTKKDFFVNSIGGMDERFYGYGGEDNEVYERADYLLKGVPHLDQIIIHQYHHWPQKDFFEGENEQRFINENNINLFEKTKANPRSAIAHLRQINKGKLEGPSTRINR